MIFPFKLLFLYFHEEGFYCNVLKLGVSLIIWSHYVTLSSQSGRFSSRLMSNPIPWWRLFNVLSHLNKCRSLMICFSGSFSSRSQWNSLRRLHWWCNYLHLGLLLERPDDIPTHSKWVYSNGKYRTKDVKFLVLPTLLK